MAGKSERMFGDDAPKANPWRDDQLGYAPFAKRLAQVVIGLDAPNGYVIGLHGQWGSGKSTAINFLAAFLKKHNDENEENQVVHIDFRPWIVAGHQDLISAFFKVLSEKLGPTHGRPVGVLLKLARFLNGTTDALVDAAAALALTVDPSGGVASRHAGAWAKKATPKLLGRFIDEPSIQARHERLKTQLARGGRRFLVTIDDIDRLDLDDIRAVMQMAKSIGQLPNVTYLLAYDRRIVASALGTRLDDGPHFAEKIIQQELELPFPSHDALLSMLGREIAFLTPADPSSLRWLYILREGVHRWIRSPRDVVRLSNAIKFLWPALAGEVDAGDVLCMEGLRLFEEVVFDRIRRNRDLLFRAGRYELTSEDTLRAAFGRLTSDIDEVRGKSVLKLLSVMFPQSAELLDGNGTTGGESFADVAARRGVGSEAGYDTYFGLQPSVDAVPKAVVDELVASSDAVRSEKIFRSYLDKRNRRAEPMAALLLQELANRFPGRGSLQPTSALMKTLFNVGETILGMRRDGPFQIPPRAQLGLLLRSMLISWGEAEAGRQLLAAFRESSACALMSNVYVARGRELGAFPGEGGERPVVDRKCFDDLGSVLLGKIEDAATDGELAKAPFYFDVVRAWKHLANADVVRAWLMSRVTEDPRFMAKAGLGLVSYSVGTSVRRYTMQDGLDAEVYDLDVLVAAGRRHLQSGELDDDTVALLTELVRGAGQLLQGRSSERTREDA